MRRLGLGGLAALVLLTGCMPASYRKARRLEGKYELGDPGEGWRKVAAGGADHAWINDTLHATLYADSNCGPRFEDLRVEDLASELAAGLTDRELLRDEALTLADRGAVRRAYRGKMDGVEIALATTVVNHAPCTYDVALIAPPDSLDAAWDDYLAVLDGFRVR